LRKRQGGLDKNPRCQGLAAVRQAFSLQ